MRNALFWTALPFLVPQALYVRATAPRFAPAAGPTRGQIGSGEPKRLLAIGDSIVAGVGASELPNALVGTTAAGIAAAMDCEVYWEALGVSGHTSNKVLAELVPKMPRESFDFIVVSMGVNDVTGLTTLGRWRRNLETIYDNLRAHSPDSHIAFAGLPPLHGFPLLPQPLRATFGMRSRSLDEVLASVVSGLDNCRHVLVDFDPNEARFADDGYHPSEEGYAEFGARMAAELCQSATMR